LVSFPAFQVTAPMGVHGSDSGDYSYFVPEFLTIVIWMPYTATNQWRCLANVISLWIRT